MALSTLQRCLLPAAILSGVIFSTATLPLAVLGSEPVTIQVKNEPVFSGQLKDLATPYLGLATAISLGVGVTSLAVMSWRQSSRKSAQVEEQVSQLQQHLKTKEAQIEELKFSTTRLEAAGLDFFLQDDSHTASSTQSNSVSGLKGQYSVVDDVQTAATSAVVSQPAAKFNPAESASSASSTPQGADYQAKAKAVMALPAAQAFMGFTRSNPLVQEPNSADSQVGIDAVESPAQINELLNHLKQVMAQIEMIHAVQAVPQGSSQEAASRSSDTQHQRVRLEPQYLQQIAS